ncbi:GNAT family N-acetyltransferase [Micromonospora sp. NPDC005173]|uniref:GNAT family N-acetyltransferase n=1 Tax=Micromonospora sp. NPDC005173 TaxID=3157165 RepID=UPI0033B434EB
MDVLSLRTVTIDDWPLWRETRLAALAEAPYAFKSRLAEWHKGGEERWRSRLAMLGSYNIVALLDDHAVGMAAGVPGDNGISELRSVWVGPKARGRGVGDRLIAAVETWALRSDARTLKLAVIPGNEAAIALYRRNGFVVTRQLGSLLSDGVTREQVMEKALR